LQGHGSSIPYAASKAALNCMTKSLARAFAPEVRVNAVAPGPIDTQLLKNAQPERIEALMRQVYTKRVGRPEEVAEAIRWLALEAPPIINGAVLDVTDGCFLR
jgi:3-oxoacyl-[acyl-carrier protein] reductase